MGWGKASISANIYMENFLFFKGFYLFLQVQFPLSLTSIKYKHFLLFGWGEENQMLELLILILFIIGLSFLNTLLWVILRLSLSDEKSALPSSTCPFFEKSNLDSVHEIPSFLILVFNTFFLVWIMAVRAFVKQESYDFRIFRLSRL